MPYKVLPDLNLNFMYDILKHAHSGLRWVVLALLLFAIYNAYTGWKSGRAYTDSDRKVNLFTMISAHVMLLLGFTMWFMSGRYEINGEVMKDAGLRFYAVEHMTMMLIAIVLITIGNGKAKRGATDVKRFKNSFWFFLIGLLIILAAIPWPPKHGAGWF